MRIHLLPSCVVSFSVVLNLCVAPVSEEHELIRRTLVNHWVEKLDADLWHFADFVTRRKEVQESFKDAKLVPRDGLQMVHHIAKEIKQMMDLKISAVKRIMDTVENSAMAANYDEKVPKDYTYYNARLLVQPGEPIDITMPGVRELNMTKNSHFYNIPVNTSVSSVHVPINVYDRAPDVIRAIKWSETLDSIFLSNYKQDPSLSWQYFGSATGFMRQFPAMQWKQEPVDLYDCRMRNWFIEAAASPKDMLILIDNSGSMTGQRKEIARHAVNTILDTLGNNDYISVMTFTNDTEDVVPCFKDLLVQANLANVRRIKLGVEKMAMASNIANFTIALTKAFELLEKYRRERNGSLCNQAIMLVTDGVPYNYEDIFERYNWLEKQNGKITHVPVRVFTYLIGREVPDVRQVKWMACANQGYYVHLSTMAEVREQVLNYIPVMARPLVLNRTTHPIIWTPIYADITDPKMTDYLWELKESEEQRERSISFRQNSMKFASQEEQDRRFVMKLKASLDQTYTGELQQYKLITSVAMPVYDRRENANITERHLVNEAFWVYETRETRIANLLGVAGIDVPEGDIKKLLTPHLLGVNAYGFIVTNNGYIILHPDLRPVFQGILKPSYNSVDMADVELVDDGNAPRKFDLNLLKLRRNIIFQSNTSNSGSLPVKYHYDNMKRVSRGHRKYFFSGISGTPFSVVLAFLEPLYSHRVDAIEELHLLRSEGKSHITSFFKGSKWKIHPEWYYCKYLYDKGQPFETPEAELMHFLEKSEERGWKWPSSRNTSPPESHSKSSSSKTDKLDKDSYFCDRHLFLSLLYDAKATEWFSWNMTKPADELKRQELRQRFGLVVAFMATRSGLTRWVDFHSLSAEEYIREHKMPHFSEIHKRAIDELWYRRAVEYYLLDSESFVYSVPHDAGPENATLVTASHAIFHTNRGHKAPAAVVGLQFQHSTLHSLFMNITYSCPEISGIKCNPQQTCASSDIHCYILDNNGFIIVSEDRNDTGRFFGEVNGAVLNELVKDKVYRKIAMYDYQGVCFVREDEGEVSFSSKLYTPVEHLIFFINWLVGNIFWLFMQINLENISQSIAYSFGSEDPDAYADEDYGYDSLGGGDSARLPEKAYASVMINRTRPQPCDRQVWLYELLQEKLRKPRQTPASECRPFIAVNVPRSNLVMVVVNNLCRLEYTAPIDVIPTEVLYDDGNETMLCHKVRHNTLSRRRPDICINRHPEEINIELCGRGLHISPQWITILISLLATLRLVL
ncbi:unnamed protein product [Bemisia tabaci]|uniref:VWFA domain-containing protein n=1 Tax=Bemisia tabaci TaxID=7038 RepID=A0A9P0AMJ7_BEMTA|nr:unnamed protein product [Bemisia tabaci]